MIMDDYNDYLDCDDDDDHSCQIYWVQLKYKVGEYNDEDDDGDDDAHNDDDYDDYDDGDDAHNDDDDDDDDYDNGDEDDVQPCQIGNSRGKDKGVETDQGIARHGKVRHLKVWIK